MKGYGSQRRVTTKTLSVSHTATRRDWIARKRALPMYRAADSAKRPKALRS